MQELLRNARQGWLAFAEQGKYAALLLAVLLFLWFRREKCKEQLLLVYTTVVVFCCIVPLTAAVLMKYQMLFYDYEWIWSYVPLTVMIAYGAVTFLFEQWERQKKQTDTPRGVRLSQVGLTVLVLAVIALCGRMGSTVEGMEPNDVQRGNTERVLAVLADAEGQEICLWAPKEIMAAARGQRGDIRLVYGRNMWDAALGAYSYEVYGETEELLYLWMCNAEETGSVTYTAKDGRVIDGAWCMEAAKVAGVNRILLPGNLAEEELQMLLNESGQSVQPLEGYYLWSNN